MCFEARCHTHFYHASTKCGKVMFSVVCVSVHRGYTCDHYQWWIQDFPKHLLHKSANIFQFSPRKLVDPPWIHQ